MAGQLTISTLSDGTNSTSSTNCIQGSAKAWVDFNGNSGASPVIRASYNVSSVTRNSTGNYTVTFTTAMSDTNYCLVNGVSYDGVLTGTGQTYAKQGVISTGNFTIGTWSSANNPVDSLYINTAVFR
jgi:hypothetical protein